MNDYRKITNSGCMHLPSYEHHLPFDVYNHSKNRIDISNRVDTGHMLNNQYQKDGHFDFYQNHMAFWPQN